MRLKNLEVTYIKPPEYIIPYSQCPCTVTVTELYRIRSLHLPGFRVCFYTVVARGIA
jgi:hypothetical protein